MRKPSLTGYIGAFVAAPIGGLFWGAGAFTLRVSLQWVQAKRTGQIFDAFDRPRPTSPTLYTGRQRSPLEDPGADEPALSATPKKGKFF